MVHEESEKKSMEEKKDHWAFLGTKKKGLVVLIAFLGVVTMFAQLVLTVQRLDRGAHEQNVSEEEVFNHDQLEEFSRELQEMTVALYYEMLLEVRGEDFDPFIEMVQVSPDGYWEGCREWDDWGNCEFYDERVIEREATNDTNQDAMEREITDLAYQHLAHRISRARGRLSTLSSVYQISYLAVHHEFTQGIVSDNSMLYQLVNGTITAELIWELRNRFEHVVMVRYNTHGRWEVPFLLADETEEMILDHIARNEGRIDGVGMGQMERVPGVTSLGYQFDVSDDSFLDWQNPRNMTFVYGIPRQVFYDFDLIWYVHYDSWDWWHIWEGVDSAQTVSIWIVIGLALLMPLSKVKALDLGYERIRKLPIELIGFGLFIAWLFVANNENLLVTHMVNSAGIFNPRILLSHGNIRMVYFHGLMFVLLMLIGYAVYYIKDLVASEGKTLKEDSYIYKLWVKHLAVDLKRSQTLKIFVLVFGQVLVGLALALLAVLIFPSNPIPLFVFVFVPFYLLAVSLYIGYKVVKVQQDYMRLFEITQALAEGNLNIHVPSDLGYFDSLKDELVTIQDGFGYAVERAVSSERMKGDLITNVSHDLKTPLTSIITYIDLLQVEGLSEEKRQQYLKTLELKTDRLKILIEDLFEVSKASSGNLKLDIHEVDVVTLMKQTVLGLEDRIKEAGLILREGYPEEGIKMALDGGRMHRVFENLIINIVKYALPGTRAYIDIIDTDGTVTIILRNISGDEINIDINDLSERFVRGETSRTTEGSGLGLAIAKSFVELQGGTFSIVVDGDLFKVIMSFKQ